MFCLEFKVGIEYEMGTGDLRSKRGVVLMMMTTTAALQ